MPAPRIKRHRSEKAIEGIRRRSARYFSLNKETCADNQRRYRAKMKAMRLTDPLGRIKRLWGTVGSAKRAATKRAFTIKFDDIDWPEFCPVLGVKIDYASQVRSEGWSLDRLDSDIDYIPGNVRVISARANVIKSFGTADEHDKIAAWMDSKCR